MKGPAGFLFRPPSRWLPKRLRPGSATWTSADTDSINVMLQSMAEDIVSAYPVPEGGSADFWQMALLELERDLLRAGLAAPHAIHLIPKARSREIFENLPVHPSVRKHDFDMFQNTLSFHLTEIGAEIEDAFDADAARKIAGLTKKPRLELFPGGFFLAVERWLNDVEQIQENDDGDRNPHKPQQNSTHNVLLV